LERFVRVYGTPKEIRIPRGKGGRMTGFAFVEMKTRKAAGKVIDALNGMNLDGREVAVDWCVSKDEWTQHQRQEPAREDPLDEDVEEDIEDNVKTEDEDEDDDGILEENSNSDTQDDNSDDDELPEPTSQTIFIRNIPYLVTRATLFDLFRPLGHISSLYLVVDPTTSLSRGTAFLTFSSPSPAQHLLSLTQHISSNTATAEEIAQYTLEGRALDFLPAVNRDEATRLKDEHASKKRDDKRNLYLLKEGDIDSRHPFYAGLSPMDLSLRKDSIKQRKDMLASNPSLHLSLTRLAVRNIPRTVEEHEFKALAIQAITEFDEEVTKELRSGLTEEELARDETGGRKGRLVRQAKIVLEKTGRSKGYGFVEYNTHANALKGLRWLNARVVGVRKVEAEGDKKRRLLVEFAIENAQVVKRRKDREEASRRKAATTKEASKEKRKEKRKAARDVVEADKEETRTKRKRVGGDEGKGSKKAKTEKDGDVKVGATEVGKIIAAKRFRKKLERGKKGSCGLLIT
jgi:nucleolar protein 4